MATGYSALVDSGDDDPRLMSDDPSASNESNSSRSSASPSPPSATTSPAAYLTLSDLAFTPLSMDDSAADLLSQSESPPASACGADGRAIDAAHLARGYGYQNVGQGHAGEEHEICHAKAGREARENILCRHSGEASADPIPDSEVGMHPGPFRDGNWIKQSSASVAGAAVSSTVDARHVDVTVVASQSPTQATPGAHDRGYDLISTKNNSGMGAPASKIHSETWNTRLGALKADGIEDIAIDAAKGTLSETSLGQPLVNAGAVAGGDAAVHHQQGQQAPAPRAPAVFHSIANSSTVSGENFPSRQTRPKIAIDTSSSAAQSFNHSPTPLSTTSAANVTVVRPKPNYAQTQQQSAHQQSTPLSSTPTHPLPERPAIVRTASNSSVTIRHPIPDLNTRSGAYTGNIAALEATAERLSMTSSIEDAIRDAHNELKRSDSRRSSILRANSARKAASESASVASGNSDKIPVLPSLSRQSSILGTNSTARSGGYSPGGYILSPNHSLSGASTRLRSASKASSSGAPSPAIISTMNMGAAGPSPASMNVGNGDSNGGQEVITFMSRHGPGKSSVRSVQSAMSGKMSLAEIAELEPPTSLTQEALDEADRVAASGEEHEDDDTIRASAHQQVEAEFEDEDDMSTPLAEPAQPVLDTGFLPSAAPQYQMQTQMQMQLPPLDFQEYGGYSQQYQQEPQQPQYQAYRSTAERPMTAASGETYQEAERAFADFDGVHSDPEILGFTNPIAAPAPAVLPGTVEPQQPPAALPEDQDGDDEFPTRRPVHAERAPRPTSYFDPATGQQMLYYPARVPAMLNLPPKLSKAGKGAAGALQNNKRRSQVMSAMLMPQMQQQEQQRASRVWLPDPLEGMGNSDMKLMETVGEVDESAKPAGEPSMLDFSMSGGLDRSQLQLGIPGSQPGATAEQEDPRRSLRLPPRLTDTADKRKTQNLSSALEGLPPQLRASAFFDLPAVAAPQVAIKDGSAMRTLDSILDAAATAPISAFTDHVFAGKLGSEVYGPEKKKKKKAVDRTSKMPPPVKEPEEPAGPKKLQKRASRELLNAGLEPDAPDAKKRSSVLSLLGRGKSTDADLDGRRTALSSHLADQDDADAKSQIAPDHDEEVDENEEAEEEEEEESEEEDEGYRGAPTTLLAELQLRKQQQKLRTRPIQQAYPNGLHSTLLELDAVHEVEKKARKGKRVNLAWEDPDINYDDDEGDDEEVPLAMLVAAKAGGKQSNMDISAIMGEVNRPLGLMERRDLEDNEPLSRRRDRLQGKEAGPAPMTLNALQARMSTMHLTMPNGVGVAQNRTQSRMALPLQPGDGEEPAEDEGDYSEPEVEGETLAARKQRLAQENPLPRARPVSGMFSSELLSQFGGDLEEEKQREEPSVTDSPRKSIAGLPTGGSKEIESGTAPAPVPEEEETLGQRRRRLQAEREAREREMGGAGTGTGAANATIKLVSATAAPSQPTLQHGHNASNPDMAAVNRLSRRLDMAGILQAHPFEAAQGLVDPRRAEQARREADAERAQREREAKMAALRAQMPGSLTMPSVGARTGGYMGGRFNDGTGGIGPGQVQQVQRQAVLQHRQSIMSLGGAAGGVGMNGAQQVGGGYGVGYNGYGANGAGAYGAVGYGNAAMPMGQTYGGYGGVNMNMNGNMGMGMPMGMNPAYGGGYAMQPNPGHLDMVERWRQSVQP